jgi:hypothetical protein
VGIVSLPARKVFALASARAAVRYPHGTADADALADILADAASLLREFIAWRDRAQQAGDEGCNYLNGDGADGADGWNDLDLIAERVRAVLAVMGELP